jgi:hypothetical protein
MSSVSMPRQRWGRFGRPWRSFPSKDFRHTFRVTRAFFVTSYCPSSGSDGSECRQVIVHPPRGRRLGFAAGPRLLRLPNASPNGAPRRRTIGCSVMSWGWRQRRHAHRRSSGI